MRENHKTSLSTWKLGGLDGEMLEKEGVSPTVVVG